MAEAVNNAKAKSNGTVRFAEDVIATIALLASGEAGGVVTGIGKADLSEERMVKKHMLRGIKIKFGENDLMIDLPITVRSDFQALSAAKNVQECVKKNVENMTGIPVLGVNVTVTSIQHKTETE